MLIPTADGMKKLSTLSWQKVAIIALMLSFSGFVLWLTASHFDASELKSLGLLTSGFVVREFLPLIARILKDSTDLFGKGGQVE